MSAHVYPVSAWYRARAERARRGHAPRLAIIRTIVLRERSPGSWGVVLYGQRYGVWARPTIYCEPTSPDLAQRALLAAWNQYRLPMSVAAFGARHIRPIPLAKVQAFEVFA